MPPGNHSTELTALQHKYTPYLTQRHCPAELIDCISNKMVILGREQNDSQSVDTLLHKALNTLNTEQWIMLEAVGRYNNANQRCLLWLQHYQWLVANHNLQHTNPLWGKHAQQQIDHGDTIEGLSAKEYYESRCYPMRPSLLASLSAIAIDPQSGFSQALLALQCIAPGHTTVDCNTLEHINHAFLGWLLKLINQPILKMDNNDFIKLTLLATALFFNVTDANDVLIRLETAANHPASTIRQQDCILQTQEHIDAPNSVLIASRRLLCAESAQSSPQQLSSADKRNIHQFEYDLIACLQQDKQPHRTTYSTATTPQIPQHCRAKLLYTAAAFAQSTSADQALHVTRTSL